MRFSKFFNEVYSHELSHLKSYMKEKPIDLANNWYYFKNWPKSIFILQRLHLDRNKIDTFENDGSNEFYEIMSRIEDLLSNAEKEEFSRFISDKNYMDAPTWAAVDYEKIVKPNTWLIHFSDHAEDIAYNGFKHGIDDITKLAYTKHINPTNKTGGGYNFAYDASNVKRQDYNFNYGKDAVIFKSAGINVYHYGDVENQVIFYGKHVDPKQIVLLKNYDNEWYAKPKNHNRDYIYKSSSIRDVINWVVNHYDQYKKIL